MAKKTNFNDLDVIKKAKINGYLQDDNIEAKRQEICDLNAEMDRIHRKIEEAAGSQYEKAAKAIAEKYNNKFIVINGDCDYDTNVKDPKFEKYRICVVKKTKPSFGYIEVFTDLMITVYHYDLHSDGWSMTFTKIKNFGVRFHDERAVKILNEKEALDLLNMLDINSSNHIGAMIQSVPEDK